eukprot:jgi/Botrbrau1/19914/Bobra.0059s0031.1
MASTIFRGPSVLLLYIALSFHPMTLGQAQTGTEVDPLIAAMQNAVLSPIPIESSAAQGAPAETNTEDPLGTSSTSPQDPTVQLEPLTVNTNPLRNPIDILNPQVQGEQLPTEDKPALFPCDGAPAAPSTEHVIPMDAILPAPGGKGTNAKPPYLNFTDMEIFPDLTEIEPSSLAQVQPPSATNSSNAKPAVCANNPTLNLYASGTSLASTCRAYLYTNSRRTSWSRCTAWFVSPTHAVLAGHCIANGGSGRYFPSLVNGRYGTVLLQNQIQHRSGQLRGRLRFRHSDLLRCFGLALQQPRKQRRSRVEARETRQRGKWRRRGPAVRAAQPLLPHCRGPICRIPWADHLLFRL